MSPRTNQNKSLVHDFAMVHWAFSKTRDLLLSKKFVLENSTLYRLMAECTFDFYHEEAADYREFKLPEQLMQDDPTLMQLWPKLTLQTYSPFLNGCVRIHRPK